jgi:hypothetical protein
MPNYASFELLDYIDLIEHINSSFEYIKNHLSDLTEDYIYNQILFFGVLKNQIDHSLILLSPYIKEDHNKLINELARSSVRDNAILDKLISEMIATLNSSQLKALQKSRYEEIKNGKLFKNDHNGDTYFNIILNKKKIRLYKNNYFHMNNLNDRENIVDAILDPIVKIATHADDISIYDAYLDAEDSIELIFKPLFEKVSKLEGDSVSITIHTAGGKKNILQKKEECIKLLFKNIVKDKDATSVVIKIYKEEDYKKMFHGRFLQVKINEIKIVTYIEKYLSAIRDAHRSEIKSIDDLYIPPIVVRLISKKLPNSFNPIKIIQCGSNT